MEEEFQRLLERTFAFHEAVVTHAQSLEPAEDLRAVIAFQSGLLALEHGSASLQLVASGHMTSAHALMRPQFESLVRGIWLAHAANDNWVMKLSEPLTAENAKRANEGPMLADMFKDLDASEAAPAQIVAQLKEYRDVTWKALNSYAHGGLHPLARVVTGYPPQLIFHTVRNSSAVLALTAQLLSLMTYDAAAMEPVRRMHREFADCLPILK